jgi:ketosteroid isomerase-like protein
VIDNPAVGANADLVRRAFALFGERDAEGLVALSDPDGDLFPYAIDERRAGGYHGHEGIRQYVADVDRVFEDFGVDIVEVEEVSEDTVYARGRIRGRTRDGVVVDTPAAWLWMVRDGRLVRMQANPDLRASAD